MGQNWSIICQGVPVAGLLKQLVTVVITAACQSKKHSLPPCKQAAILDGATTTACLSWVLLLPRCRVRYSPVPQEIQLPHLPPCRISRIFSIWITNILRKFSNPLQNMVSTSFTAHCQFASMCPATSTHLWLVAKSLHCCWGLWEKWPPPWRCKW